ncbi:peptidoglycan DD-metalloendopeptidase family protein [Methylomonas sp. AM2-LC]|uniref:murein hydrolase activator EnvC family protein n=1 Tax=Methylomonas sp. AM2-LC TaxID=3153301 RepID=UPI003266E439
MKFCIGLLIAIMGSSPALALAAVTEKQNQLSDVQSQIRQVTTELKNLSAEKSVQLDQLKILEKRYGEMANIVLSIKANIKQQEEKLQEIRNKITLAQKDFHTQKHALEGLIKSAYTIGDMEGLKLILNQRDPSLSGRMLIYHDYISRARLQKLQLIQENSKTLHQLESEKDNENQLLKLALEKKQQETDNMQALKIQREKLLLKLDSDYLSKNQQMERLLHDEKKLASLVASLQKTDDNTEQEPLATVNKQEPNHEIDDQKSSETQARHEHKSGTYQSFLNLQGQLPWPVMGAITEHFGSRRFETTWDGAILSAREGADIHAIAAGKVVYADWLRGYGLMLILDHGGGYMSLYGFNQSLHKNVGEQVVAGETLASVGRSGGRAEAALYFGIRKMGRPVNPELWCRTPGKN